MFGLVPPDLEAYLPVDEDIPMAPVVGDEQLGQIFRYGRDYVDN